MRVLVVVAAATVGVVTADPRAFFPYPYIQTIQSSPFQWLQPQPQLKSQQQQQQVEDGPLVPGLPVPGGQVNTLSAPDATQQGGFEDESPAEAVRRIFLDPEAGAVNVVPYTLNRQVLDSFSPLMKLAVDTGVVRVAGVAPWGAPRYAVSPHLASEVGGVSSLAYRLGAVPVAAVHDVQARPNFAASDSSFSPVLVHQDTPEATFYTLELPSQ